MTQHGDVPVEILQLQQLAARIEIHKKSLVLPTALLSWCTLTLVQFLGQSDGVTMPCVRPASCCVTSVTSTQVAVCGAHPAPCPENQSHQSSKALCFCCDNDLLQSIL